MSPRRLTQNRGASQAARAIAGLVDFGVRARLHVEVHGLDNFSGSPATLVVSNHRRDTDGPIIGNLLLARMDELAVGTAPFFVAREDLFRRGFLRPYLADWPVPVRELLGGLNLRPILEMLHLFPMRRIRERTLGEVLEDVRVLLDDPPLGEVLRPRVLERFEGGGPRRAKPERVSDVLHRRFRPLLGRQYGLLKLTRACFRSLRPFEEATIEGQLRRFVGLLDEGAVLLLEPEGAISQDGSLGRLRGALRVLLNRPQLPVRVLPIGIAYDFMTSRRRQWVFVNVGREILGLQGCSRRETSARVTEAMLACSTMTASLLASRWLLSLPSDGAAYVTRDQLEERVRVAAERCRAHGLWVDPRLLEPRARRRRISEYLEYCRRSGRLVPWSGGRYLVRGGPETPAPSWTNPTSALDYVGNELASLRPLWSESPAGKR